MKRVWIPVLVLAAILVHANAEEQHLILRRVFVAPVVFYNTGTDALLVEIPNILATRITSLEPFILVPASEEAHTRIITSVQPAPGDAVKITIQLFEKADSVASAGIVLEKNESLFEKLKAFIDETARSFAPRMGKVKPEVRLLTVIQDEETMQKVEKIEFDEQMATDNELELQVGSLANSILNQPLQNTSIGLTLPIIISYTWFLDRFSGVTIQFLFEQSSFLNLSSIVIDGVKTLETSENTFFLPGVGYTVRSLGQFSTTFSFIVSAGAVFVKAAHQPLTSLSLAQGDSTWLFYTTLSFHLSLCCNFTPAFSLKIHTGISLDPVAMASAVFQFSIPYSTDNTILVKDLLGLGVSLRF